VGAIRRIFAHAESLARKQGGQRDQPR
jgi:hypothetical protein